MGVKSIEILLEKRTVTVLGVFGHGHVFTCTSMGWHRQWGAAKLEYLCIN